MDVNTGGNFDEDTDLISSRYLHYLKVIPTDCLLGEEEK